MAFWGVALAGARRRLSTSSVQASTKPTQAPATSLASAAAGKTFASKFTRPAAADAIASTTRFYDAQGKRDEAGRPEGQGGGR